MFNRRAPTYAAILIIYLVIITLLRWSWQWQWGLFWLGGFFGLLLYDFDHVVYLLWQAPEEPTSILFKQILRERRGKEAFRLLEQTAGQRTRLVAHSVIFQGCLLVLAFFTVSSTYSFFGQGMMMGLFLHSLIYQGRLLLADQGLASWFWQTGVRISTKAEAFYYLGLVVFFIFFSGYLI